MSDKDDRLKRKVSFRITDRQDRDLDRLIKKGMNPSFLFRVTMDKMLKDSRRRRF